MKTTLLSAVAGGILLSGFGFSPVEVEKRSLDATLVGQVVASHSSVPIANATIELSNLAFGSRTNSDGRFMIAGSWNQDEHLEIVVRHPCFHTVRVEWIGSGDSEPLILGMPVRWKALEYDPSNPVSCAGYDITE